jgi:O-antigen ligase
MSAARLIPPPKLAAVSAGAAAMAVWSGWVLAVYQPSPPAVLAGATGLAVIALVARRIGATDALGWATAVVSLSVLLASWNGVRAPGGAIGDVVLAMSLPFLLLAVLHREARVFVPPWIVWAAAGFISAAALSALTAPLFQTARIYLPTSFVAGQLGSSFGHSSDLEGLIRFLFAATIFPVILGVVGQRSQFALVACWIAGVALNCVIALSDTLGPTSVGEAISGFGWSGRASALSIQPNALAAACAMLLPIPLAGLITPRWRRGALVLVGLLLATILSTGSRAGLFGAVIALVVTPILVPSLRSALPRYGATVAVLAIIGLVVLTAVTSDLVIVDRLSGDISVADSDAERRAIYESALEAIAARPVTGIGFSVINDAHNIWLQLASAGGVIAVAAFIVYLAGIWRLSRRRTVASAATTQWRGALLACVLTWITAGLLQNQISDRFLYVPVGLLLADAARERFSHPPRAA